MTDEEFQKFPSIARLSREVIVTEKIDGTNAQIYITHDGRLLCGSRSRYITIADDNHGFAKWVNINRTQLMELGVGRHYGEWWGLGIQSGYGLKEKRFSLFNVTRWCDDRPACCDVVPVLYRGEFNTGIIEGVMTHLLATGSLAAPGFMHPEGIVIYHVQGDISFKKTFKNDDKGKSYGA